MVVPRRLVPLPLLTLALVPGGVASAAAAKKHKPVKGHAVPCLKADGETWGFAAMPTSCVLADESAQERVLVPVKKLRWTTWSAKRARGTGTVKGEGYSGKVVVTATRPQRCSARRVIYTDVNVAIPKMGIIAQLTVACPG